jgi:tetratricopeptide (TPR) repeat protein
MLIKKFVMSARAQNLKLSLSLVVACVLFLRLCAPCAVARQTTSVPASRVAEACEQARGANLTDEAFADSLAVAYALVSEGRFEEAAELFVALTEKRPRDPAALYGAALATFNAGRATQAEPLARRAVEAALDALKDASNASVVARGEQMRAADSRGARMRAADALVLLAVVVAVRGDEQEALKTVERAAALAPEHFDAQFALGRARFGAGDDAGAVAAFRAAVALNPSDARARFFLATALEHAGDEAGALDAYRELAARQPRVAEGHLGLGVLLVKRGGAEGEEGLTELRRALEINPNLYEARVTLGRALVARGRAAESVEHLRRAAELAPGNPEPHYQLSLAYKRLGRKEDAAAESAIVKQIHESRRVAGARVAAPVTPDE